MSREWVTLTGVSVLVILLQYLFIDKIAIVGISADVILIPISAIALQYGRMKGMVYGFGVGFLLDIMTGFWGVNALAKTIAGFIWGSFYVDSKPLIGWYQRQYLQVFIFGALFHFAVSSGLNYAHLSSSIGQFLFKYVLGQTAYTFIFTYLFAMYFWTRKR